MTCLQCWQADDSLFPPIAEMLKKCGVKASSLKHIMDEGNKGRAQGMEKIPPHAQLAEDELAEVPVHNAADTYVARLCVFIVP